jgi:hypothetical protein
MQIPTSICILIQLRNKIRTQWQRIHYIILRLLINSLKEQIDSAIKEQVSSSWQ